MEYGGSGMPYSEVSESSLEVEVGSLGPMFPELGVLFCKQEEQVEGFKPERNASRIGL